MFRLASTVPVPADAFGGTSAVPDKVAPSLAVSFDIDGIISLMLLQPPSATATAPASNALRRAEP